ncbi:uncharacterized protein K452DRAFT_81657 [Aplosporella prunicola CBS 121167]|uniref:Uncharacterized protein n=1 Tax=Aplosporella prunicola CBS 121167 TaxID=1176127 RepID=A0A6A6B693_9PEZI|nr:uncharacterized protein K452DRAFT_81657 [Aplosporella prunicola CBS 121167]KAF2139158.1 hypothetical protein K452DRAFT_81657 [Aplosporella prunicola CBS 121167]
MVDACSLDPRRAVLYNFLFCLFAMSETRPCRQPSHTRSPWLRLVQEKQAANGMPEHIESNLRTTFYMRRGPNSRVKGLFGRDRV